MSFFTDLTKDNLEQEDDRLGGGGGLLDTGIYSATVKLAYAGQSANGARNVNLIFQMPNGNEFRETIYITNRKGEHFYLRDGKQMPLPGFSMIDSLCTIATEKPLAEQETSERVVKLYDFDQKAEVNTKVTVLTDLLGKSVSLAILRVLENKSVKDSNNVYQPTAETRELNTIDKVFHTETKLTVSEARKGLEAGEFWDKWEAKNAGKTRDSRKIKGDGVGNASAPQQASQVLAPKKSLFSK